MDNYQMMNFGYGGGFMWILFLILIVFLVYAFARQTSSRSSGSSVDEKPLDILKKRYAKGDISKEEFERMKKDLES